MQVRKVIVRRFATASSLLAAAMLGVSCSGGENTQGTDAGSDQKSSVGVLVWQDYKAKPTPLQGRRDLTTDEASAVRHFLATAERTEIKPGDMPSAYWDVRVSIDGQYLEIWPQSIFSRSDPGAIIRYRSSSGVRLLEDRPGETGKPSLSPLVDWWRQSKR